MIEVIVILVILVLGTLFFLGSGFGIRALARVPFRWTFTPENTFCAVVTDEEAGEKKPGDKKSGDDTTRGGNIVKALHGVTGKRLDKSSPDRMNWIFVNDEEDPAHDALLYRTFGVQDMGSIFHTTRLNIDRRMRFAREDDKPEQELHALTKARKVRNVFYTGELTVVVKESDTVDKLGVNFEIDFAFARRYPIRSILKLADSAAFLTSLVENIVNSATVGLPAGAFIGGEGTATSQSTKANRDQLILDIQGNLKSTDDISKKVLEVIGIDITAVSLRSVSMTPAHRALLEKEVTARKVAEAEMIRVRNEAAQVLIKARAQKKADMLDNDADADRVERVTKPAAENDRTVAVRFAETLEKNETLTHITYAPGAKNTVIPVGGDTP